MDKKSNFRRGAVELLILHLLSLRDYYGYDLSLTIKNLSNGILDIPVGSLYPALYKLIDNGCITDYKKQAGRRLVHVYYHIEQLGMERLDALLTDYYATNNGIKNILDFKDIPESEDDGHDKSTE
jgi:PadR family transcriptional regulator PadR